MASVKLAPFLEDMIGSMAEVTYSHVRSCLISKTKSFPGSVNPFQWSQKQLDQQNLFKIPAAHWKELTALQRTAWCNLAQSIPEPNKFGDNYYQAGFNLYTQVQHNRQLISYPIYDNAPVYPTIVSLTSFNVLIGSPGPITIFIDFPGQTTHVNTVHLVYCSPPCNGGRFYFRNQYRFIRLINPLTINTLNITPEYSALFPLPTSGQKIAAKLIPIHKQTGFSATPLFDTSIYTP